MTREAIVTTKSATVGKTDGLVVAFALRLAWLSAPHFVHNLNTQKVAPLFCNNATTILLLQQPPRW